MPPRQLSVSPSLALEGWELVVILLQDQLGGQSNRKGTGGGGGVVSEPYPSAAPLRLSFLLCTVAITMPASGRILAVLHV